MTDSPIRLTPFFTVARHLGASFVDLAGWRFPEAYRAIGAEIESMRSGCALADVTPHGKILIEGSRAAEAIRMTVGQAPEVIGSHVAAGASHLYRLRHDQFYFSTPPGDEPDLARRLEDAARLASLFVTVTDVTHGLADMLLMGPSALSVLRKVCALDVGPGSFPDLTAKRTSLAKVPQLIIRRDLAGLPAYSIIGARSHGAYVWDVLMETGREFGIVPVGVSALRALEAA